MIAGDTMITNAKSSGIELDRRDRKQLMQRTDRHGLGYFFGWLGSCAALGVGMHYALGTWWIVPVMLAYGPVLGVGCYSMSHECAHGTAFKSRWLNEALLWISSLVYTEEPIYRRCTHADHHTHTWITGQDSQMNPYLPMTLWGYVKELSGLYLFIENAKVLVRGALGKPKITDYQGKPQNTIPAVEVPKLMWNSRLYLAVYGGLALWAILGQTWIPVIYFFLPRLIGQIWLQAGAIPQHAEMQADVADLRLSTRTWRTHPIVHFFQWNMAYHLEHHLYPTVPFHALPKLHAAVRDRTPAPAPGTIAVHVEILRAILRRGRARGATDGVAA